MELAVEKGYFWLGLDAAEQGVSKGGMVVAVVVVRIRACCYVETTDLDWDI